MILTSNDSLRLVDMLNNLLWIIQSLHLQVTKASYLQRQQSLGQKELWWISSAAISNDRYALGPWLAVAHRIASAIVCDDIYVITTIQHDLNSKFNNVSGLFIWQRSPLNHTKSHNVHRISYWSQHGIRPHNILA